MVPAQDSNGSASTPTRDVKDEPSYRRYAVRLLLVSLLLQTIAIATPGWLTWSSTGGSSRQNSIFYFTSCTSVDCETLSKLELYSESIRESEGIRKLNLENLFLEGLLREIICVLLSWLLTLVSAVVLNSNREKRNFLIHAWFVLAAVVAVTGTIMGQLIYLYLVRVDYYRRYPDRTAGFPYCLFMYAIACLLEFGSVFLMFKCHHDEVEKIRGRDNGPSSNGMDGTHFDMRPQEVVTGTNGNQPGVSYHPPVAHVNSGQKESRLD